MKKVLSVLLAAATALTVCGGLAACGGDSGSDKDPKPDTITVWCPAKSKGSAASQKGYNYALKQFKEDYPQYASEFKYELVSMEEDQTQSNIVSKPVKGAEVFLFPSDHLKNLRNSKILMDLNHPVDGMDFAELVKERDNQEAVDFVTRADNTIDAFPATWDNGYFLWYNKDYFTGEDEGKYQTLEGIIEVCKKNKMGFNINYGNPWYSGTFLFGTGCEFNFDVQESKGHYQDSYNTPEAKAAAYAMRDYAAGATYKDSNDKTKNVFVNLDNAGTIANGLLGTKDTPANIIASISNTVVYATLKDVAEANHKGDAAAQQAELDKIAYTTLPTFKATIPGGTEKTYHMGTFYGAKYCGVNKYKSEKKVKISLLLANYLTRKEGQLARFKADNSGPSNTDLLANNAEIKADPRIKAFNDQIAIPNTNVIQGNQPQNQFWGDGAIKSLAVGIFEDTGDNKLDTNAKINAKLEKLAKACKGL